MKNIVECCGRFLSRPQVILAIGGDNPKVRRRWLLVQMADIALKQSIGFSGYEALAIVVTRCWFLRQLTQD
jgi:hypothetical protein